MKLTVSLLGESYSFRDLKQLFAKANEEKSGDMLAGIGAEHARERMAAKLVLADLTLADIRSHPLLPAEEDEVSRAIEEGVDEQAYERIRHWTVGELREQLLSRSAAGVQDIGKGLNSEMAAAAAKLMSNLDLIQAAAKCEVITCCNTVLGGRGRLGSRAQPNHPTDDPKGVKASIYEALSYGVGDAVIGINPVIDTTDNIIRLFHETMEVIRRWSVPTQNSVLAHVTTQMRAIEKGAPADLIFQSLAGTQSGNASFGIDLRLLEEADRLIKSAGTAKGENRWYFETGQGSELSAGAHHGIDQVTLESRCYGLAKRFKPYLLNTVVGFIGPEYLYDSKQVIRAGLEDHFMGKIQGLPMGVDVCYTNHMRADQNDMDNLAVLLAAAGVSFFIGVPMGDDCMLNYQSTSFHDIATVRELLHLQPGAEFAAWAESLGILQDGRLTALAGDPALFI
ncbi:ethanolamine ammonia-lyase subunit EutB [Paenibacillus sp. S150]|uniref:ethanolamine ammonia-lyase subunit EutB n=1 Tax=Paenibacillus sp. S150 TaxID=2749826 RepID=UPI001C5735D1|nr:ethanolamine ammonia-lyase subunit EutB [Paenibacillus sp. S150]MBW4083955.1 ethanolamine ammonia-lyase subunit EutB [Paenibacillus sp. S150]